MSECIQAPSWFIDSILSVPEHRQVEVEGASISYRVWGGMGPDPGVLLVHGAAAHAGWWDHIAPLIDSRRRVVAIDLSGHGLSDHRDGYSIDQWSRELAAVTRVEGLGPTVLVGHSMGAFVALRAAGAPTLEVAGVLVVDPPVRQIDASVRARRARIATSRHRILAQRQDAVARWRPVPPAQQTLPFIRAHVADGSVRQVPGGWSWAFDPRIYDRPDIEPDAWTELSCAVDVVRAEHGLLTDEMADQLVAGLGSRARRCDIAGAGHHVMLDQPLLLADAVSALLDRITQGGA